MQRSCENSRDYIDRHLKICEEIKKPLVMEEFGYPRDGFCFTPEARDSYYKYVFQLVADNMKRGGRFAGCNFWAWGGFAQPPPRAMAGGRSLYRRSRSGAAGTQLCLCQRQVYAEGDPRGNPSDQEKIGISDVCLTNRRKSRKVKRSCRNIFNSSFFGSLDIPRWLTVRKSKIATMQFT